jgi:hypothetical protein
MKAYHTSIKIAKPLNLVWNVLTDFEAYPDWNPLVGELTGDIEEGGIIKTFIIPLNKAYYPKILSFKKEKEIIWMGAQGSKYLLAGKHYYNCKASIKIAQNCYMENILQEFCPIFYLSPCFAKWKMLLSGIMKN